jgi:hypothetical protein
MTGLRTHVPTCAEHERLAFEVLEMRKRGRNLRCLRGLTRLEQSVWDRREQAALAELMDHERKHGCGHGKFI